MKKIRPVHLVVALTLVVALGLLVLDPAGHDAGLKPTATQVTLKPKRSTTLGPPVTFTVASFNLLGTSHTRPGGHSSKLASGPTRMRAQLGLLDEHGVDVVGLQELQLPQWNVLAERNDEWGVHPGGPDRHSVQNSVAWRRSVFTLVETHAIEIPYFFGRAREMPYVLLEHITSGQRVWVATFHNPADVFGTAERWRATALRRESRLARRLAKTPYPVIFTGDMNERETYFCGLTAVTDLRSANGGSNAGGKCRPPSPTRIDWIFGTSWLTFTEYTEDDSPAVARTSDHPLLVATVVVPGLPRS